MFRKVPFFVFTVRSRHKGWDEDIVLFFCKDNAILSKAPKQVIPLKGCLGCLGLFMLPFNDTEPFFGEDFLHPTVFTTYPSESRRHERRINRPNIPSLASCDLTKGDRLVLQFQQSKTN